MNDADQIGTPMACDVFTPVAEAHWDTLLFLYGAVLCVGGSLLSVGSTAGVALMGQARGKYTLFWHTKWMPATAAGYVSRIAMHVQVNHAYF